MRRLTLVLPLFKTRAVPRRRVPSGLLSLAAEVQAIKDVRVEVVDAESLGWDAADVVEYLVSSKPDAVGISVCSPTFPSALELTKVIRTKMPEVLIVLGGKYVTHSWQSALNAGANADAMVRGDGESAIAVLAQGLAAGANRLEIVSALEALPNVWVPGKKAPTLPPAFNLQNAQPWPLEVLAHNLDLYQGDRMLIEFSRGCPGRCSYCLASRDRQQISFRPVAQVVETIAHFSAKGFSAFFFTDDDFAASPNHLASLLEGIVERGLKIKFDANVRPDSLVRCEKIAPLLKRAGCRCLWLGIESGSPAILETYRKGFDTNVCERAVVTALIAADVVRTNWIIGAPLETRETVNASMDFATRLRRLGPHVPHISFMVPYPGTPLCDEALALGLISPSHLAELAESTHDEPVMPSQFLTKNELKELFYQFHQRCFTPESLASSPPAVADEARLVLSSAGLTNKNCPKP
ncbi:B12-binding domain-containing radical SAM protein [Geomonas oryzisoli]|uniref:B12-binding domain-containing radical SAM protein n=1 Tax=Geomonas oryzisoli TaxID=2847992 RepID=A0ABX8J551_9BACT|nr:radical SAM protein [Geomonas oryzisoli]QWV92107.1 B12-binding domain-containing radical SAM protein [Geomonas oryzisoli]